MTFTDPTPSSDDRSAVEAIDLSAAFRAPSSPYSPHLPSAAHESTTRFSSIAVPRLLAAHCQKVNGARRKASASKAKVQRLRDTTEQRTRTQSLAAVSHAEANASYRRAETDPSHEAIRHIATVAIFIAGAASAVVLFLIDRVQLRGIFTLLSIGMVSVVAAFLGLVQAVSAHVAGEHRQHAQVGDTTWTDNGATQSDERTTKAATFAGVGTIAFLAMYRMFLGEFALSVVFGLGSLAIWVGMFGLSRAWASKKASAKAAAAKALRRTSRTAARVRADLVMATGEYHAAISEVRSASGTAAADMEAEVLVLHKRQVDAGLPPFTPVLPTEYDEWVLLRNHNAPLPQDLALANWDIPAVVDTSRIDGLDVLRRSADPSEPYALGSGS